MSKNIQKKKNAQTMKQKQYIGKKTKHNKTKKTFKLTKFSKNSKIIRRINHRKKTMKGGLSPLRRIKELGSGIYGKSRNVRTFISHTTDSGLTASGLEIKYEFDKLLEETSEKQEELKKLKAQYQQAHIKLAPSKDILDKIPGAMTFIKQQDVVVNGSINKLQLIKKRKILNPSRAPDRFRTLQYSLENTGLHNNTELFNGKTYDLYNFKEIEGQKKIIFNISGELYQNGTSIPYITSNQLNGLIDTLTKYHNKFFKDTKYLISLQSQLESQIAMLLDIKNTYQQKTDTLTSKITENTQRMRELKAQIEADVSRFKNSTQDPSASATAPAPTAPAPTAPAPTAPLALTALQAAKTKEYYNRRFNTQPQNTETIKTLNTHTTNNIQTAFANTKRICWTNI